MALKLIVTGKSLATSRCTRPRRPSPCARPTGPDRRRLTLWTRSSLLRARLVHRGHGPSGSGKSTLMHCMAGLDRPTSGWSFIAGQDIATLDDTKLTQLRRDRMGFVFQSFNLVPTLTAAENITLAADLAGTKVDKDWFDYLVSKLGLTSRLSHRPGELSGGQQQRVACVRALINKPDIVFADEPTGNLDSNASAEVLAFFCWSVTELAQSIVMVAHDPHGAAYADRVVFLADGKVVDQLDAPTASSVLQRMQALGAKGA